MRHTAPTLLLLLLVAALATGDFGPSGSISSDDIQHIKALVGAAQEADGAFGDAQTTWHAVGTLTRLGEKVPRADALCKALSTTAPSGSAYEFGLALATAEALSCVPKLSGDVSAFVAAAAKSGKIAEIYGAALAVDVLSGKVDAKVLAPAVATLGALADGDGLFLASADDDFPTPLYGGWALEILAIVQRRGVALSGEQQSTLDDLVKDAADIFNSADGDDFVLWFYDESEETGPSGMTATGQIIRALSELTASNKKGLGVESSAIVQMAEYLVENKHVASLADAFGFASGVQALVAGHLPRPLVVQIANRNLIVSTKAGGPVQVSVTDLAGKYVGDAKVKLDSAAPRMDDSKALASKVDLQAASKDKGNTLFHFDLLSKKPTPGFYHLVLSASVGNGKKYISVKQQECVVKVTAPLELGNVEVFVSNSMDRSELSAAKRLSPPAPGKAIAEKITLKGSQHLHVAFTPSIPVHQAFIVLAQGSHQATFLASSSSSSGKLGQISAHVDLVTSASKLTSGSHDLILIAGDPGAESSVTWVLGSVDISLASGTGYHAPEDPFTPLPTLKHTFRTPEVRPAEATSMVFTAAVLAPFLVLVVLLIKVGANLGNFPSGAGFLSAVVFHGGLGAMLLVLVAFFVRLDAFTASYYLGGLSVVTSLAGYKLLSSMDADSHKPKQD